ncbi:MAG TPA: GNAT family N-acetyltransferase [Jiangellaceae bacterium]|nr:GNAT family N-acetyltransferase [Jiangellaceae bacterium]
MTVSVVPVTPDRWDDLVSLFGPNGAYGNCWCAYFRVRAKDFTASTSCEPPNRGRANRGLLERLTHGGAVPGLLAYEQGEPVGWVSVSPRDQFVRILLSRTIGPTNRDETDVWSVVCFWLPARRRRGGLGTTLLAAAVDFARSAGASVVEGYPVDTAGERRPGAEVYTGTVGMFRRAGFSITSHPASGRPIARLPTGAAQ